MILISYSEKELHQVLAKLYTLMNTKITGSVSPDASDMQFLTQVRSFMDRFSGDGARKQNNRTKIQTQLRTFLKKGNSWEKLKTPVENVSIIKVPIKKQESAILHLVIEFMKREIDVKNSVIFQKLREVIEDARVTILIREIDAVNSMKIRLPS